MYFSPFVLLTLINDMVTLSPMNTGQSMCLQEKLNNGTRTYQYQVGFIYFASIIFCCYVVLVVICKQTVFYYFRSTNMY